MPVLDLGNIWALDGSAYLAQITIRSLMGWPNDEKARKRYFATIMANHLGQLQQAAADLPDPVKAANWFETVVAIERWEDWQQAHDFILRSFANSGGFLAVANAPALPTYVEQLGRRVDEWFAAGLILAMIRRMATHHADLPGGASVNKAVFILERVYIFPGVPRNSHDIRRAWSAYKTVAHFCAALFDVVIDSINSGFTHDTIDAEMERRLHEEFPAFLTIAYAYQRFGTSYVSPRAKGQPLLDPAATWLIPEDELLDVRPYVAAPLSAPLLAAARAYRAPIPGA